MTLAPGDVHVIEMDTERGVDGADVLDADERAQAGRFVFATHRRRFIAAHVGTRMVLSRYLSLAPGAIRFVRGPHGKPAIDHHECGVRFNLSHSGDRAMLAVAREREVGIDIEEHRPVDSLELARTVFSEAERRMLYGVPRCERQGAFYRGWTRKESFIKALGDGLTFPLDGFAVSLAPDGRQLLLACAARPDAVERWTVVDIPVDGAYSSALTAERFVGTVLRATWRWNESGGDLALR